jgi:hypothetical protein
VRIKADGSMSAWVGGGTLSRYAARVVESICTAIRRKEGAHEHTVTGGGPKRTAMKFLARRL